MSGTFACELCEVYSDKIADMAFAHEGLLHMRCRRIKQR